MIDGDRAGWLGELHPRLVRQFELPKAPVVFELDRRRADRRAAAGGQAGLPAADRAPRLGAGRRRNRAGQALLDALERAKPPHVDALRLFDVYRGAGLTEGQEKPCDSCAYAGYFPHFDGRRHRGHGGRLLAVARRNSAPRCAVHSVATASRIGNRYASELTMTLTKAELADLLFEQLGLNKREAKDMVERFFEEVRIALEAGESVKLSGFGNFQLREKPQRPGRNPKTGEEIPITARRVVTFHASQKLKAMVEAANHAGSQPS